MKPSEEDDLGLVMVKGIFWACLIIICLLAIVGVAFLIYTIMQ
jgi:hypothetical protein